MILCITLELTLLILIIVYVFLATILGLARRWDYLKSSPDEKKGKEYHFHDESITFTLAGFSLTAIALLVSIQFNELAQISSTLEFFSIAFTTLILSSFFIRLRIRRLFTYLADVFLNAGLLSIGCGLLVFFVNALSLYDGSTIVFIFLIVVTLVLFSLNYLLFDKYAKRWRGGKNRGEK